MNALCAIHDRRTPDRHEDFESIESADFGVTHVVASESWREAAVRFEDDHVSLR
jgi:hypothetical protein